METWADFSNLPRFLIIKTMIFKRTYSLLKIIFIFSLISIFSRCEKKLPVPTHLHQEIKETVWLNGTVKAYETNPEGDIDKIILNQKKKNITIHFPPHVAKYILEIAKKNHAIQIKAVSRPDIYELISISSEDGKSSFDVGKILPPKPSQGKKIIIKGKVFGFIKNRENDITGFIINHKTIMLNPEQRSTLVPLLMKAHQVEVRVLERNMKEGTVNTMKFPPVRMMEIKIDSIIYKTH